jgi:hypothetical protein
MIYEYRKYTATPGNLPNLHNRFEEAVLGLFERHGIDVVGFWTPVVGGSNTELHYIVRWSDLETMEKSWAALFADPETSEVVAKFDRNGAIVASAENQLWNLTSYSPTP